jgi:hypothetical protein
MTTPPTNETHGARRRTWLIAATALGVAASALLAPAAAVSPSSAGIGSHAYMVNIIGRPNDFKGSDDGGGRAVWIGLKTNADSATCEATSGYSDAGDDGLADMVPAGRQRIAFVAGDFGVLDKDATDGQATISIPADTQGYDVYVRVLGKPGGCLDADGFVQNSTGSYFLTGHIDANRKSGVPQKVLIDDILTVQLDTDGDGVADETVSVFDSQFTEYFWNVENDGLRLMQLVFVAK